MKWLNSLDELLYEVMSWLVFYPLTFWRAMTRPLDMMAYADRQLLLPEDKQYSNALSPPLFLILTLLVAHGLAVALGQTDQIVADRHGLAATITDDSSALLLRVFVFAIFPLVYALRLLRATHQSIDRESLRQPFYAQCYPAALFALGLSLSTTLATLGWSLARIACLAILAAAFLHFMTAEARWFAAKRKIGLIRAVGDTLRCFVESFALLILVGVLFTR
ncbi:hypothetical protein [Sphingobium phenoxybenzoativorans]|uniref:hypothetical protein n=1 Tax=Sphingobium phenoxybenzoativorans TaxID=1592790 RepID=UPI000A722DAE|nr:hypothetical protein [Sphingobium phenoxybenzoativorans]